MTTFTKILEYTIYISFASVKGVCQQRLVVIETNISDIDRVCSPLWVTQCLSRPSLDVGNLSRVFHLTSCLFPPTLRMTGPPINLLATIRNGEGGLRD